MAYMKHLEAQQAILDNGRMMIDNGIRMIKDIPNMQTTRTVIGANIIKYEFMDEPSKTLFRGKLYFEGGEEREVRILKSEKKKAKKIFRETSKLEDNKAIMKLWFATYCEHIESWVLCYDHFDCLIDEWVIKEETQKGMRYGDDLLHTNAIDLIRSLLYAIIYIHTQGLFHTELSLTSSYVVLENEVKIINIGMESVEDLSTPVDDAKINESKVKDLMDYKDLLKTHILQPKDEAWNDRNLFFSFFDLTATVRYDLFIEKLMKHSFLMKTAEERMLSFFMIELYKRDIRMIDKFRLMLESESFKEYLNWDNKMGENLRSIYDYKDEKGHGRDYNSQSVMHLIELIRNAYRHPGDNSWSKLDKNVRSAYSGLLHRIHEVLCRVEQDIAV